LKVTIVRTDIDCSGSFYSDLTLEVG